MADKLWKSRPTAHLLVPSDAKVGTEFVLTLVLEAPEEVALESLDAWFTVARYIRVGSGESEHTDRAVLHSGQVRVMAYGVVPQGRSEYPIRCAVPDWLPPTYTGVGYIRYELQIRASIPWWPDAKAKFDFHVAPAAVETRPPTPFVYATHAQGPQGQDPYFELSLASDVVHRGGVIQGSIAFFNTASSSYRGTRLALIGREDVQMNTRVDKHELRPVYFGDNFFPEPAEGISQSFALQVPAEIQASFSTPAIALRWFLRVRVTTGLLQNLTIEIPVLIEPYASTAALPTSSQIPLSVGVERVLKVWSGVASEFGLTLTDEGLFGEFGETVLQITREHRDDYGLCVVAHLRYPALHLGLRVAPSSFLQKLTGPKFIFGHAEWDSSHRVEGREVPQVSALLEPVVSELGSFNQVTMDDFSSEFVLHDSGVAAVQFRAFVERVVLVAQRLSAAHGNVPAPASMVNAVESWTKLATQLSSSLETTCMGIRGQLHGTPVHVRTIWEAENDPSCTRLCVFAALDAPFHTKTLNAEELRSFVDGTTGRWNAEAATLLQTFTRDALSLSINEESVQIDLPAPMLDTAPLLVALEQMVRFTLLTRRGTSAYR